MTEPGETCENNDHSVCAGIHSCSCRTALESHFIFIWTIEAVKAITFFGKVQLLRWHYKFDFAEFYDSITQGCYWHNKGFLTFRLICHCKHSFLVSLRVIWILNQSTLIKFRKWMQHGKEPYMSILGLTIWSLPNRS